ncbi:hypothetical protein DFH06DRAFT_1468460 [Mycena polygramma]|nr:hypothetical protein DFH06DRAFT_1468460 [Mycena polygramma]
MHYEAPPVDKHVPLLLQGLSTPGDISTCAALLLLDDRTVCWFQDDFLSPILRNASVWSKLVHKSQHLPFNRLNRNWYFADHFICLGFSLASIPEWRPSMSKDLFPWVATFFKPDFAPLNKHVDYYNFVLTTIWKPDLGRYEPTNDNEKALALTFVALRNGWEQLILVTSESAARILDALRCTNRIVFNIRAQRITQPFMAAFYLPLHDILIRASETMKLHLPTANLVIDARNMFEDKRKVLAVAVRILENIIGRMPKSPEDIQKHESAARKRRQNLYQYWEDMQAQSDQEIWELEKTLNKEQEQDSV